MDSRIGEKCKAELDEITLSDKTKEAIFEKIDKKSLKENSFWEKTIEIPLPAFLIAGIFFISLFGFSFKNYLLFDKDQLLNYQIEKDNIAWHEIKF